MKKYSFSSVDNTRKRYAFSSYQHPKTTHTYLFEAELKQVIQANQKFYHFENKQVAKRYDFTAHLNYVKRYDFEMKLIQFENSRMRKYDFVATKPHKRYDFASKRFKRETHYHFESWYNEIVQIEVVRPCEFKIRNRIAVELMLPNEISEVTHPVIATLITSDKVEGTVTPLEVTRQTFERIEEVTKLDGNLALENISIKSNEINPAIIVRTSEASLIKQLAQAVSVKPSSFKYVPSIETASLLASEYVNTDRQWVRAVESTTLEPIQNAKSKVTDVIFADIEKAEFNKKQFKLEHAFNETFELIEKPISTEVFEVSSAKEIERIERAESIQMHAVTHKNTLNAENAVAIEQIQANSLALDVENVEIATSTNKLLIREVLNVNVETFERDIIEQTQMIQTAKLKQLKRTVDVTTQAVDTLQNIALEVESIEQQVFIEKPLLAALDDVEMLKRLHIEVRDKRNDSLKSAAVDITVVQFENIHRAVINAELKGIEKLDLKAVFDTQIVRLDPFKLPNDEDKKPMWLIQSRPRWGARYFTQVRR